MEIDGFRITNIGEEKDMQPQITHGITPKNPTIYLHRELDSIELRTGCLARL